MTAWAGLTVLYQAGSLLSLEWVLIPTKIIPLRMLIETPRHERGSNSQH